MSENTKLLREKLVVIIPEIRVWTGTRAMHESDYNVGSDGNLPPKQAVASYGLKNIIDPGLLKPFAALKTRAEAVLESSAVRFLGGWALEKGEIADRVCRELDSIKKEYETLKKSFMADYDRNVEIWAHKNPSFAPQIQAAKLCSSVLDRKLSADYEVIAIAPAASGKLAAEEFDKKVESGLTAELIRSINVAARKYLRDSFHGRTEANQRILSTMRKLHSRLVSLEFLSGNISPLAMAVAAAIAQCPKQGMIEGANFWMLQSMAQTLASESQLTDIIEGRLDCTGLLEQSRKALVGATTQETQALLLAEANTQTPKLNVEPVHEAGPKPGSKPELKTESGPKAVEDDLLSEMEAFFNMPAAAEVPKKAVPEDASPAAVIPPQPEVMSDGFFF